MWWHAGASGPNPVSAASRNTDLSCANPVCRASTRAGDPTGPLVGVSERRLGEGRGGLVGDHREAYRFAAVSVKQKVCRRQCPLHLVSQWMSAASHRGAGGQRQHRKSTSPINGEADLARPVLLPGPQCEGCDADVPVRDPAMSGARSKDWNSTCEVAFRVRRSNCRSGNFHFPTNT